MWSGLAQQLSERQMTLLLSIFLNSTLAAASLAGSRQQNLVITGLPFVTILCMVLGAMEMR
jgi:hypothetical protein